MFKGTYTALATPFKDGLVDTEAFSHLIERQIADGIDGIVPVGTTGECPTLSHEEHLRVIDLAVRRADKRTKVIAGTGSNSTLEAIDLTRGAQQLGADAALLVAPYYNKPSPEGLYRHFRTIAESSNLPLILYSIPGRCGIEISVDTVARLARDCSAIVAIKEAGGTVERVSQLRQELPDSFAILSGDDSLTVPFMSVGAVGVISVASNLIPREVKTMVDAALALDFRKAEQIHRKYYKLYKNLLALEPNPVAIKAAMAEKGWMRDEVRLPLTSISEPNKIKLLEILRAVELL
jgi:4-hydroxy-tetrahydrodipicolinate synthase